MSDALPLPLSSLLAHSAFFLLLLSMEETLSSETHLPSSHTHTTLLSTIPLRAYFSIFCEVRSLPTFNNR